MRYVVNIDDGNTSWSEQYADLATAMLRFEGRKKDKFFSVRVTDTGPPDAKATENSSVDLAYWEAS